MASSSCSLAGSSCPFAQQGSGVIVADQVIGWILGDQALQINRRLIHLVCLPAGQQESRMHGDGIGVLGIFLQQRPTS